MVTRTFSSTECLLPLADTVGAKDRFIEEADERQNASKGLNDGFVKPGLDSLFRLQCPSGKILLEAEVVCGRVAGRKAARKPYQLVA